MILNFCKKSAVAVSIMLVCGAMASACGWEPEYSSSRFPAFQFVDTPGTRPLSDDINSETVDFWCGYTGNEVSYSDVRDFIANANARSVKDDRDRTPLLKYLYSRKDTAALDFLQLSLDFSDALNQYIGNVWDYTGPEQSGLPQVAAGIKVPARSNPMFERYVFLAMRAAAALHDYDKVISIWSRYKGEIRNQQLLKRMEGYLGGAYYHTGRYADAISIFAANGDSNSLNWCLAHLVGTDNLSMLMRRDPESDAVYYVLQDYMNYLWLLKLNKCGAEYFGYPVNPYRNGATVVDDDLTKACRSLIALADSALADSRLRYPMVWATARAFAWNLLDDNSKALESAELASKLAGTEAMKQNLWRVALWIDMTSTDGNDPKLADRLNTLFAKAAGQAGMVPDYGVYPYSPGDVADFAFLADFLVPYVALQTRDTAGFYRALAMMEAVSRMKKSKDYREFKPSVNMTGSLQWRGIKELLRQLDNRGSLSPLDKAVFSCADIDVNPLYDAMGRIELASGNYAVAAGCFDQVDPYWMARQGYYPYLQKRTAGATMPFGRRQRSWQTLENTDTLQSVNYRADYCRKLQEMESRYNSAEGEQKARAAYEFANALFQASAQGDLWAIGDNGWSVYSQDGPLSRKAAEVLEKSVGLASDQSLKARMLFGQASILMEDEKPWQQSRKPWDIHPNVYKQLALLLPHVKDSRITGCDVLKQYISRHDGR